MTTDPHAEATSGGLPDLRAELDRRRESCPVEHDGAGTWALLRHADVLAAALDPGTFSSAAGSHRAVPNSLDGAGPRSTRSPTSARRSPCAPSARGWDGPRR
ncbi:hypothetical protein [Nocardioides caldifontis]|uniref:hypothetical protein n=1 Tax=Nocardioides caldifontis TaxID=2588938 RepID=UPI001939833D|nr:hypothetical protein [Nocardioides caldifontis]